MRNEIIFDIDWTLWNASSSTEIWWNKWFKKLWIDKKVTAKQIQDVSWKPFKECIEILFPWLLIKYPNLMEVLDKEEINSIKESWWVFYDFVISWIKKLSKNSKIFLISNCLDWYLDLFLEKSWLRDYIVDYDCNGMSWLKKPKMIENMINKHSLKNVYYVGDTVWDQESANIAWAKFIFVSYWFWEALRNPLNFSSFDKLVNFFEKT